MVLKKKEKVSKVVRRTKKPRTTYKRRNHKGLKSMEVEAAAVKSTTASLADCTEKVLQDLGGMLTEIKQAREINKHVIGRNVRTHQMLDLFLAILNGLVPYFLTIYLCPLLCTLRMHVPLCACLRV